MGIQHGDNSLIDVVSLEKRMGTSQNPDFRYSGATSSLIFELKALGRRFRFTEFLHVEPRLHS